MRHNPRQQSGEAISKTITMTMSICELEQQRDIAVLTPTMNLGELVYEDFESVVRTTLDMLDKGEVNHVVIDFDRTDYFGSHVITLLLNLGKKVRTLGGKMALAGLSAHEKEVLKVTKLATFWPVYSSKDEAIEAVKA